MGVLPESIEQLLDSALVSELTVIDPQVARFLIGGVDEDDD